MGCRLKAAQRGLLRVVRGADGVAAVDGAGRAPGRGAYLHLDPECVRQARRRRALERALRCPVPAPVWDTLEQAASARPPQA